jgi:PKD repeat protein
VWCDFSATPLYGDYPLTVQFTDLSDGSPAFWQWDFGDGDISWDQNPEHEYTLPGIYSVTLMIWNGDLSQSDWLAKSGYITVLDPSGGDYIEAGFTVDVVEGYAPLTVNFTDASGGFAEWWDWDFGDGDSSQEPDPTHTYTTPGTYSVTQTVSRTNDAGDDTISDTTTQENLILVRERPAFYIYANQDGDEKFRWEHKVDGTEQVVLPDETTASLPFSFQDALTDTNVVELGFELEDGLGEYEFVAWTGDCFDPGGSLEGQELSNPLLFQVTDDCTIGCTYRRLV